MSGHSKWSQIKRQKGVTDAKRANVFAKHAKIIALVARKGADPKNNSELRATIERARAVNMPAENIERAIKKGSGGGEGANLEAVRFEAYGPEGVGIIIEAITDNNNRTVQEIKHLLAEHNAKFGAEGSVAWAFEHKDGAWLPKTKIAISEASAASLDTLLEALDDHADVQEIYTNAE
jgi:YebC/PmpR family DNA-binding regulatory protein